MLRPLLPIASDTISDTFAQATHITTIHAKYGSNHLQKELSDSSASLVFFNDKMSCKIISKNILHIQKA